MKFKQTLQPAVLIRRYKRFLADVELPDGATLTVHCPNSGSMLGCREPGMPVMLSQSDNRARKYAHTLELVQANGCWVGINTSRTNHLVREALENGVIDEIPNIRAIQAEVKTSDHTRLDFLIRQDGTQTYLEVKNCTLAEDGVAMFPDAVTTRGTKHLHELLALKQQGHRAAVLFCVQRRDASRFAPAAHIDPAYAAALAEVCAQGVLALAYQAEVSPTGIRVTTRLPVDIGKHRVKNHAKKVARRKRTG